MPSYLYKVRTIKNKPEREEVYFKEIFIWLQSIRQNIENMENIKVRVLLSIKCLLSWKVVNPMILEGNLQDGNIVTGKFIWLL